jgi:hypothetical protein
MAYSCEKGTSGVAKVAIPAGSNELKGLARVVSSMQSVHRNHLACTSTRGHHSIFDVRAVQMPRTRLTLLCGFVDDSRTLAEPKTDMKKPSSAIDGSGLLRLP